MQGMATVGESPPLVPGMYDPSYLTPDSKTVRTISPLGYFSGSRDKKNRRKKRAERDLSDISTHDGYAVVTNQAPQSYGGRKERKKGSKCVVM